MLTNSETNVNLDFDDGEWRTLPLEDNLTCVGGDSGSFDNPVMGAIENRIAMEEVELLAMEEANEKPVTTRDIEQPIFSKSPVVVLAEPVEGNRLSENADPRDLDTEVENKLEEVRNEIDDVKNENVTDEFSESTDVPPLDDKESLMGDELEFKSESVLVDGGNIEDSSTLKKNKGAMESVADPFDEIDNSLNLEVGSLQKPTSFNEEMSEREIAANLSWINMNAEFEVKNKESMSAVTGIEQVQAHSCNGCMKYDSGDMPYDTDGDELMTKIEALESRTRTMDDKTKSIEDFKVSNLDKSLKAVEINEEAREEEELPSGNLKTETNSGLEIEKKGCGMLEKIKLQKEGGKVETEETSSGIDEQSMHDSPVTLQDEEDETISGNEDIGTQDTEMETETDFFESGKSAGGKRKRGKFSKNASVSRSTGKSSKKKVREDVCFICFQDGELVVCGRRGCPKAYHPSCLNRDEALFRSKGRWNCGWHLCSICEKNACYMCYTCAYSLCKSCAKDAVIFCVRGNKGFCETCMRAVNLIEFNQQGSDDTEVDFDDRSSWEYLFKDYYTELKEKLSLSPTEIAEANNHCKGAEASAGNKQDINYGDSGSEDSNANKEPVKSKIPKLGKHPKGAIKEESVHRTVIASGNRVSPLYENAEWASMELLEFVSHMKDGDISVLSQFDVQALLLEYIKRNKLRDPRRGSQILCDARLKILFGKPRVGHFEMLKLIESHFLLTDEPNDDVQSSVVDTENLQFDTDGNTDTVQKGVKDKKRKSSKKSGRLQSNLDDYAAIDMHNIGLIYLRRKLMEDLLEDAGTFPDKVIGTFVRIRISGSNQKQDLYRLVQVVGTSKSPEPYKVGKKTTEIMVDILNLDKTEAISIDTLSNQDFTEEERKRLRQSIKCGLITPLTVGMILAKTMELQMIRVNDLLESEILRISHLCDRASDLGRRKEHRECVEKLQLLKTPQERKRRLEESPEINADPKMDPNYESEDSVSETENTPEAFMRSMASDTSKRPRCDTSTKEFYNLASPASSRNVEYGKNMSREETNSSSFGRDKETHQSVNYGTTRASTSPVSVENSVKLNESEKIWKYIDPSGKIQGPFSILQLRKWNKTGYFPANMKIWKATERQENAFFLTDALTGNFPRELPFSENSFTATNSIPRSHSVVDHSVRSRDTALNLDKEIYNVDRVALLFPHHRAEDGKPLNEASILAARSGLHNIGIESPNQASVISVTPLPQQVIPGNSAVSQMPVQNIVTQNPHPDNQAWGGSAPLPGQPQGYSWGTQNVQNSSGGFQNLGPSGMQPDAWKPIQGSQQDGYTQNGSWNMGSQENFGSMGMRPENDNGNMCWVNPAPGNGNVNWAQGGNQPNGLVNGSNMQGFIMASPGWAPTQGWNNNPPSQGQMPGDPWGQPGWSSWTGDRNQGPPPPTGNINQSWGRDQGSWTGPPNQPSSGGQNNGSQPWNRQSSFGKRDTVCPYNANGRCKKGSRCDYMHS